LLLDLTWIGSIGKMIRKISITIIAKTNLLYQIYEEVKDHIYPPARKECIYTGAGNLKLVLDEDSPAYKTVLHICKNNHVHPHIAQWVHYSSVELKQVKYFKLSIPSPLELEGTDASDYGTLYSDGCPFCGMGRKPIGDILVDRKFLRKYKIGCLHPEIFVSEDTFSDENRLDLTANADNCNYDVKIINGTLTIKVTYYQIMALIICCSIVVLFVVKIVKKNKNR
jgi:hypothetical protein